jgi:hypothetical protein
VDDQVRPDRAATDATVVDPQLLFLRKLAEARATIAGDVIALDGETWAIHGSIAVDGEVIMAEYASEERARVALGELAGTEPQRNV